MSNLRIVLPSGRMLQESLSFLQTNKRITLQLPESRELTFYDAERKYQFYLVRNKDVPLFVLHSGADAGICGRDLLLENEYDFFHLFELPFGYCRLSLAIPEDMEERDFWRKNNIRVATKYPNLTKEFFFRKGLNVEIIPLHGSIEIAPKLQIADCIVDLVSTGKTLKDNQLKEIDVLATSQAMLIVNRGSFYNRYDSFLELFRKLEILKFSGSVKT